MKPFPQRLIFASFLRAALLLAATLPLHAEEDNTLTSAEAADGWKLLFNGKNFNGWKAPPDTWSVENGAITNTASTQKPPQEGKALVWGEGDISDFELAYKGRVLPVEGEKRPGLGGFFCVRSGKGIEFAQQITVGTRAGFFRDGPGRSYITYPWGKKVRLSDSGNPKKPTVQEIGDTGDPKEMERAFARDDWNDYKIIAIGNRIRSFVAGKEVCDLVDETSNAPKTGLLQLRIYSFATCVLQFKDIKLKRLIPDPSSQANSSTAAATPARTEPARTPPGPSQPVTGPGQLRALSDQFPAAKEWALARLDSPVPGIIADDIARLKAALAEESALNAQDRDAQNAYRIGMSLCDALIFTFKARAQAYQQAGGSAIHAPGADAIQEWDGTAKSYDEQLGVAYAKFAVSLVARGARQSILPPNPPLIVIPRFFPMPEIQTIPPLPPPAAGVTLPPRP
jgi:hypothetical protein